VTEALKKFGGKATVVQLKSVGCSYSEIQKAIEARAITKTGGNPVHQGADVRWEYQIASKKGG